MLFMGQELAVPEPFCYFADHDAELAAQVRAGREKFLAQFPRLRDTDAIRQLPLPSDETRFLACRMQWQDTPVSTRARQLHSDLLTLRRTDPVIGRAGTGDIVVASSAPTPQILLIRYQSEDGERLVIVNLGRTTTMRMNDPLLAPPAGHSWQMAWCSEQVEYGGSGVAPSFGEGQWRLQPRCTWLLLAASVGGFSRPAA
jgi:maltooligosyltrehalose trehalohydrolase